ncbi:error-prone DNA polymerase [Pseudochelatococcus lubricantis]|uniref:Error-prone DNA polymerase n=1 Tax=Pseudochelatococcus lubricantis TaxID=1538102 RepID=A0ABX0UW44_9HYPH|nr:error-prone DNA polymerase [Pseudochelatococcus lubricantis]NIJ56982.1 error-prone DNA polymerase [Pseudochelatococcus lubricantis]
MQTGAAYAELQVTTNYSFLRGASHPEELVGEAARLGLAAIAVTDRQSVAGVVRAHHAAKEAELRLVVGCRLDLTDGPSVLVYPTDHAAWSRLTRLLTVGNRRAGHDSLVKGERCLAWADLAAAGEGQIVTLLPDAADEAADADMRRLRDTFPGFAYVALCLRRRHHDTHRLLALEEGARALGLPVVAVNDVLYHARERRILHDTLTAIRHNCTIDALGFRRARFADRFLKAPGEMARLFAAHPQAIRNTLEIVDRCRFSLAEIRYQYPVETVPEEGTPQEVLERLVRERTAERYGDRVPERVARLLRHELALIGEKDYAPYFLTVHAIVSFARSRGILCQGRGSAANSMVCFVLGITSVDFTAPHFNGAEPLFERFISSARQEPPDIDVDFEHDRREEVIQWIFERYGRDRAALAASIVRYRRRGALRDAGKAMGLSEDVLSVLARHYAGAETPEARCAQLAALGLNADDRRLQLTLELADGLKGFPRHASQHPCGIVISRDRLDSIVPIAPAAMQDRQVIEWDKDDIDRMAMMKVDVLGLGMLGAIRGAFALLRAHKGIDLDMSRIEQDDVDVYEMMGRADTIGVFQIESRAQMSMLPRLRPRHLYDLTIQIAIVRPGPIQGNMVHPYLRRRGRPPGSVKYPSRAFEKVLGRTLGVPLFQEQVMQLAVDCAGFSPDEADELRRSMATFRAPGTIERLRQQVIDGMVKNGYTAEFAARTFTQLQGFGAYGFPESHSASFALIAYVSAWLKYHHPEVFCCALLNAQPMGFYGVAQLVRDARNHGVAVRPVDVNRSHWDCTLEREAADRGAVRLGLRMVKGLTEAEGGRLVAGRGDRPYETVGELAGRGGASRGALMALARADALAGLEAEREATARRPALWAIAGMEGRGDGSTLPLFGDRPFAAPLAGLVREPPVVLPAMPFGREIVEDYDSVGLSLRGHPVALVRRELARAGYRSCRDLAASRDRQWMAVAGLVLVRQRPGSAKGVMFMTIEDETGNANAVFWQDIQQRFRPVILGASLIGIRGRVQREGQVIHLVARSAVDLGPLLRSFAGRAADGRPSSAPGAAGPVLDVSARDFR